jgi:hypothetical protein
VACVNVVAIVPVVTTEKSVASTAVTASLKVAFKITLLAPVVELAGVARLFDCMDGAI